MARCGKVRGRRDVAVAAPRASPRDAEKRYRRHEELRRAIWRRADRWTFPKRIRRFHTVGARRHRRAGICRQGVRRDPEGRDRIRRRHTSGVPRPLANLQNSTETTLTNRVVCDSVTRSRHVASPWGGPEEKPGWMRPSTLA